LPRTDAYAHSLVAPARSTGGRQDKLPLKILGTGELTGPVTVHAAAYSASAKEKIEAAGGVANVVPVKEKWTRAAHAAKAAAETQ
jgi:large subunit ribosomal protein L15